MASASKAFISAIVTCYFIISIALVFSNKLLMSQPGASIPAPLFVTWYQCALTAVIIHVLGWMGKGATKDQWLSEFPAPAFDLAVARKVLPLSLVFVGMVTFNNLCLLYVEVSFYNVARSLTIVSNVILTRIFLGEKTSYAVLACLAVVIAGFYIGSEGEINFSLIGTVFGVLSSVFVSLNSILTKTAMDHVQGDKWRLAYYNNVNASIIFLPLILAFGEDQIILQHWYLLYSAYFWFMMNIAGVLGFAIGIATVMQINYTSPLTHNISGTAKACVQTILALLIWKNPTTVKALLGVFLVIFGSGVYTWVRMRENDREKAAKAAAYQPVKTHEPENVESDLELGNVGKVQG